MTDFAKVFSIYANEPTPEQPTDNDTFSENKRANASKFKVLVKRRSIQG